MSNKELIAEARKLIANCATYNFGMYDADKLAHEVAGKLVDALALEHDRQRMDETTRIIVGVANERNRIEQWIHVESGHNGQTHWQGKDCFWCRAIQFIRGEQA